MIRDWLRRSRVGPFPLLVFAFATTRIFIASRYLDSPYAGLFPLDQAYYLQAMDAVTRDRAFGGNVFLHPPGYPAVLSLFSFLEGRTAIVFVSNTVFQSVALALLYAVARRVTDARTAFLVALLFVAHHTIAVAFVQALSTSIQIMLVLGCVWAISDRGTRSSPSRMSIAGGAMALLIAVNPAFLLASGALAVYFTMTVPVRRKFCIACFVASSVLVIGVCLWNNIRADGSPLPISANGGLNLYIGNNPAARPVFYPFPELGVDHKSFWPSVRAFATVAGHGDRWYDVDQFYYRAALDWIWSHPASFAALAWHKLTFLLLSSSHDNLLVPMYVYELDDLRFFKLFAVTTPYLLAAAALLVWSIRDRHLLAVLSALAAVPFLMCILCAYNSRYRDVASPLLMIVIGTGLYNRAQIAPARRRVVPVALGLLLAAVWVYQDRFSDAYDVAQFAHTSRRQLATAMAHQALSADTPAGVRESGVLLARAIQLDPASPDILKAAVDHHLKTGNYAAALDLYPMIYRLTGEFIVWPKMYNLALRLKNDAMAVAALESMAALRPDDQTYNFLLAHLLASSPDARVRDLERARRLLETATALRTRYVPQFAMLEVYVALLLSSERGTDGASVVRRLRESPALPPEAVRAVRQFAEAVVAGARYEIRPPFLLSE